MVLVFGGVYYCYSKHDKKKLENFANQIVNESIAINTVVEKNVKYTVKGKQLSLFVLNFIRQQYKKEGGQISVYSVTEAGKNLKNEIQLKKGEKLYYVKFNEQMIQPFIITKECKIVVLFVLTKGEEGMLSDSRSDE